MKLQLTTRALFLFALLVVGFSFGTSTAFAAGEPVVIDRFAEDIMPTSARPTAEVTDEGVAAVIGVWVEYGITDSYGSEVQRYNLHELTIPGIIDASLTGLTCDTTYHYRFKVRNNGMLDGYSPDATFTTTPCYSSDNISHWTLNEASGTRVDSIGDNDLSPINAPLTKTGQVNDGVEATVAGTDYLSIADNASLSTGGETSFTVSMWVKLNAKTGTQVFVSKFNSVSTGEYAVYFENLADRFVFSTYGNNQNYFVYADELGSPTVGTWYYITATHNALTNTNSITVNNGAADTLSSVAEHQDSAASFLIGAFGPGPLYYANAVIDEVRFSKTEHGIISNNAPVLNASRNPIMTSVIEDASVPTGAVGTLVSSLVDFTIPAGGLDNVSDVDSSPSTGIAVTATNSSLTCYYSINSGSTWSPIGAVSSSSSRLLSANVTNRIYCRAGAGTFGTFSDAITLRAWDQTTGVNGSTTDTTTSGGTTAFSTTTDTAALTITSAGNHAPVAVDDEYTVDQNSPGVALAVMGNDTDPDNDTFTITDVSTPDQGGNAQNILSGTEIGYTPAPGFCGDEQFTYEISDGNGETDVATVTMHVVNCDTATDAPTLVSPATGTTYYNNVLLPITFTLPETLLHNSLRLIFTSSLETSFVLNLRDAAPGTNTFNVDPRGNIDQLIEVLSTTSNSIPVGTYTVTISYQDVYGNTSASATSTNVTIADPVVVSAPSSGSGYNPALAWNPSSIAISSVDVKKSCPADKVLTQNLRSGSRNGKYNSYTKGIVTEAHILQAHLNRLGFSSGKEDGILGPKSDNAIKKLQKSLGTLQDGKVGPQTRGLINNSCK
jgi:hypothetical protein